MRELITLAAFLALGAFSLAVFLGIARNEPRSLRHALRTALTEADAQYILETEQVDQLDTLTIARLGRKVERMRALPAELHGSAELWIEAALVRDEVRRTRNVAISAAVLAGLSAVLATLAVTGVFSLN